METLPLISVIVPVYKVEPYLDVCVRSIVEQTYSNLEIILVDDGSPDNCGAICDAWAAKDSRVRVIHKENGGLSSARNAGIEISQGEFLGFVDSDDYIAPEMYEQLQSLMDEETDVAECDWLPTLDDTAVFVHQPFEIVRCAVHAAMESHIRDTMFLQIACNKLFRRGVIGDIRFPIGKINEDEFWTYQILGRARKLVHASAAYYAYRQQESSIMHKPYSLRRLDGIQAKRERLAYIRAHIPALETLAKQDLFFTCLYAMQGSLRWLSPEDREAARQILKDTLAEAAPLPGNEGLSKGKAALLAMGKISLEITARCLNFLEDIHILR